MQTGSPAIGTRRPGRPDSDGLSFAVDQLARSHRNEPVVSGDTIMPMSGRQRATRLVSSPTMRKSASLIGMAVLVSCSAACSSSGSDDQRQGVEVTVVNSNRSDVMIYGSPFGKPGRLIGCRNPGCTGTQPGDTPSGSVFGWIETRSLPRTYRMVLIGTGTSRINRPVRSGLQRDPERSVSDQP
jgi:hypothetical protein